MKDFPLVQTKAYALSGIAIRVMRDPRIIREHLAHHGINPSGVGVSTWRDPATDATIYQQRSVYMVHANQEEPECPSS